MRQAIARVLCALRIECCGKCSRCQANGRQAFQPGNGIRAECQKVQERSERRHQRIGAQLTELEKSTEDRSSASLQLRTQIKRNGKPSDQITVQPEASGP